MQNSSLYSESHQKIQGLIPVIPGILYGQNERVDELNTRIYDRVKPDEQLQPNIDLRPASTKYSYFPIIDLRKESKVDISPPLDYSISSGFTPTVSKGPVVGYFDNVAVESQLRNQYFALQRGANQGTYVPSSQSDLYRDSVPSSSNPVAQPFPDLFTHTTFQSSRTVVPGVGRDQFFNNTRTQLRGTGR
jgi:hypothetical protein